MSKKEYKIDKKDLKGPDVFISTSDQILAWVEKHSGLIITIVVIAIVAGSGYIGYSAWNQSKENQAAEDIFKPENELKKVETKIREERAEKMKELAAGTAKDKKETKPETLRPADYAKDYAPIVEQVKQQIQKHAGTKAAMISALNLSGFLVQQKQFGPALEVLDIPKYQPSSSDLLSGLWHLHRGLAYLENQKTDEAIKEYETVVNNGDLKYFHPEALLKLGVAYEMKGDLEKARQAYERVGKEFPNTEASNTGRQYMRLLELKSQQG